LAIIILDLTETDALHTFSFAAAILALGVVYWLIPTPIGGQEVQPSCCHP
jgi:uncharacterized membrane protein (DUF373 family)